MFSCRVSVVTDPSDLPPGDLGPSFAQAKPETSALEKNKRCW